MYINKLNQFFYMFDLLLLECLEQVSWMVFMVSRLRFPSIITTLASLICSSFLSTYTCQNKRRPICESDEGVGVLHNISKQTIK